MLNLAGGVRVTWFRPEPFHPSIADTVEEDDKTLDKLCSRDVLPIGDRDPVPCPAEFGKGTQEASKGDKSITPENAALNEVGEANINVIPPASTRVNDGTGQQLHETSKDQDAFQCGENDGSNLLVPGFLFIHLGNDILEGVV